MKKAILMSLLSFMVALTSFGQITTSTLSGVVKNEKGETLAGATVHAVHQPSGSEYRTSSTKSGLYTIPAVRVGGPYIIHVSYVGYKMAEITDIQTLLGSTSNVDVVLLSDSKQLSEVTVVGTKSNVFSKDKTGAAQQFGRRELTSIPIAGARTIDGITKYNPFGNGNSFGAQDSRLNNFTIDGSQFNNNFGLGSSAQAGGRTGASAISLDAIDQLQVNVAPFDIRQSGFVGAGINAVTRSGTNEVEGSVYQTQRNNSSTYVGNNARGTTVTAAKFDEKVQGFRLGAPIIKNKLFIFGNYESIVRTEPGTTWISEGSPLTGTQISRVKFADMQRLSNFMKDSLGYVTGPWEGYSNTNDSRKFLIRVDWNINKNNKLTARYVNHNSSAEINISNSQSAGAGNRTTQFNAMSFKNSGYIIQDNTRSAVLELNSKISNTLHNNLIVSYDKQIEDRAYLSQMFPTIDIREGSATYTSVGFDPFTPGNKLNYWTFNVTNNLTKYLNKHTLVGGFNYQSYQSNNLFFPASNGVYIFNSLNDFYTAARQSIANGGRPSTFAPARFQLRYSALPGAVEPMQVLEANRLDLYVQDEFNATKELKLTFGIRANVIDLGNTALENKAVSSMIFANGEGFNTSVLPKTQFLIEPRFGFNYDLKGQKKTQIRGGTGVFTGRPPYVFLSNQVGNNGVLTGFIDVSGAAAAQYGFTANPNQYFIPSTPTLPSTFDLAFTNQNYKFPQVWKNNIAIDQKLPWLGLILSAELLYNKTIEDFMSAGSIASGSWQSAVSVNGNNNLGLSISDFVVRNRIVGLLGYRIDYGKKYGGATTITLGYVGSQNNPFSYIVAGDLNGDRVNNNDLVFVPNKGSDIRFAPLTVGTRVYTEAEQQASFEAFISQDPYLSTRRGQYAERNALDLPFLHRFDLSIAQDVFVKIGGKRNSFQIRADILNFGNMVNNKWGVSQRATNPQLLNFVSRDASNIPTYRLATQRDASGTYLIKDTYQFNSSVFDVWSAQLGIRYTFGK